MQGTNGMPSIFAAWDVAGEDHICVVDLNEIVEAETLDHPCELSDLLFGMLACVAFIPFQAIKRQMFDLVQ